MNDVDAIASSSRAVNSSTPTTQDGAPTAAQIEKRRKENREMFNKKRGQLLDDLIYNLDILVYAQLSAIYYMDCSFIRFILRCLVQFVLLTPKPPTFVQPPDQQPFVGAVLVTNIFCIALHIWLSPATGTEATRGYLHGGLAMDFIGQKGPASRVTLVLFDFLVMALQFIHLTAHITRKRLKNGAATASTAAASAQPTPAPSTGQDLDSEERGVRHSAELEHQNDIEMQTLNPSGHTENATSVTDNDDEDDTNERDSLLSSNPPPRTDIHIFDSFHSGQIVLADLNIWKTAREQFWAYQKSTAEQREARRATYRAQLTSRLMDFGIARLSR